MKDSSYRQRIYENYSSNFQDFNSVFDEKSSRKWGRAYKYYFRGWLSGDKNVKIIDIACGGGRLLHFFKNMGYKKIEGADLSPPQVHLSKQVVDDVWEVDAIKHLMESPNKYDLVTGLDIVEHFHKAEVLSFLDACYSAINSGGRLILQTPNAESPWSGVHRYNDFTHEVGFNPNLLTRLLALSGFENIEVREMGPVPYGYSFLSSLRFILWRSIASFLKFWNLVETGSSGSGVFTRMFLISAQKK
jgi:2-polyprenyl-3-methyl-5-hydroxy-6-metoxy-1,4-benzoquinol methylase